jgi:hypothetical protein
MKQADLPSRIIPERRCDVVNFYPGAGFLAHSYDERGHELRAG